MVEAGKLAILLTIPITVASIITVITFLATIGVLGDFSTVSEVAPVGEIPFGGEQPTGDELSETTDIIEPSTEDLISQFLDAIGAKTTETFGVITDVKLLDANQEEVLTQSRVTVQPLEPQEVIVPTEEEISPERFFINTGFHEQLTDDGRNKYHQFSAWDLVKNGNVAINVFVTTKCSPFIAEAGEKCIRVQGRGVEKDSAQNARLYGLSKEISVNDWTREGNLELKLDYGMNLGFQKFNRYLVTACGDTCQTWNLPITQTGNFQQTVQHLFTDPASNTLTIQFGAGINGDPDEFRIDAYFDNVQVTGNSVAKREAINLLQTLTIVENQDEGRILDLGFMDISLSGETVFDGERVILQGVMETRIDDKTITTHALTAGGTTIGKQIPIKIDGQPNLVLRIDEQSFTDEEFHNFKIILRDLVVNVGEGEDTRTFEYHRTFVAYLLELQIKPDQIVAFDVQGRAIEVFKNDSTLKICGQNSGTDETAEPIVLPPQVSVIESGFIIAESSADPEVPSVRGINEEFCQTIPELPRETVLTFKIGNLFFDQNSPLTQKNWILDCNRESSTTALCTSNFGYSETITIN